MNTYTSNDHARLWKIVSGAVKSAMDAHPEFIIPAPSSITKRVVGAVMADKAITGQPVEQQATAWGYSIACKTWAGRTVSPAHTLISKEYRAALGQLLEQVYQMKGMFPNDEALQLAIKDAEDALES